MSSTDPLMQDEGTGNNNEIPFCKWVSLTSNSDQFDIDCGMVRCRYATADFMATADGDTVVVVPATFRFASQMIAHAVVANHDGNEHNIDIIIRRPLVRCIRPYRFAYIDGRHYDVMGISDTFMFVHRDDTLCNCSYLADAENDTNDINSILLSLSETLPDCPTVMDTSSGHDAQTTAAVKLSSFISSLMEIRSSATQCSVCRIPSNYRQVLEYLTKNIDRLFIVDSNINNERMKQTKCLNDSTMLLQYQNIKTNMLNQETENCRRFIDDLVSSLLEKRKAIFRTGDTTVFVKIDETRENECSANERFMNSIINSQKQMIANLTNSYKEISIMINTMQLFGEKYCKHRYT